MLIHCAITSVKMIIQCFLSVNSFSNRVNLANMTLLLSPQTLFLLWNSITSKCPSSEHLFGFSYNDTSHSQSFSPVFRCLFVCSGSHPFTAQICWYSYQKELRVSLSGVPFSFALTNYLGCSVWVLVIFLNLVLHKNQRFWLPLS